MNLKTKAFLEELSSLCMRYEYDMIAITGAYGEPFIWVSDKEVETSFDIRRVWRSDGSIELSDGTVIERERKT